MQEANLQEKVRFIIDDALEVLPTLKGPFDLVFIDADKLNYGKYYDLIIDMIPSGAFILADNVLWYGKVIAADSIKTDKETKAIVEFNNKVHEDPRVENVLLPVRDGIMILRKL